MDDNRVVKIRFSVEARTHKEAYEFAILDIGRQISRYGRLGEVTGPHLIAIFDETVQTDLDLVGRTGTASILGLPWKRLDDLRNRPDFPATVPHPAGEMFELSAILRFRGALRRDPPPEPSVRQRILEVLPYLAELTSDGTFASKDVVAVLRVELDLSESTIRGHLARMSAQAADSDNDLHDDLIRVGRGLYQLRQPPS